MYDVIIIGGGAAGLSAAIYCSRGAMKTLVLEKAVAGGQINKTDNVDNYPGFLNNPSGFELADSFRQHALKFGAEFSAETVKRIEDADEPVKTVCTRRNEYKTRSVIFATGAEPRHLNIPGEDKFAGCGMSYCATCDGAFFKGQETAVIGGGNTAFEEAVYMSGFCKRVYIIARSDKFRANAAIVASARANDKIEIITDTVALEIKGDTAVSAITVSNVKNGRVYDIPVSGVFAAIGTEPNSELAGTVVTLTQNKFIRTDRYMATDVKGIFAAGDVRDTPLRQIITAAADGAVAAVSAMTYVNNG